MHRQRSDNKTWMKSRYFAILKQAMSQKTGGEIDITEPVDQALLFFPHLTGEKTVYADPFLRGALMGITPRTGRAQVTRAIFEGIGFAFRQLMEAMSAPAGTALGITGKMSEMDSFMQILADILGENIKVRPKALPNWPHMPVGSKLLNRHGRACPACLFQGRRIVRIMTKSIKSTQKYTVHSSKYLLDSLFGKAWKKGGIFPSRCLDRVYSGCSGVKCKPSSVYAC